MTATLASALVAAQKEMPAVPKAATTNYGKYATLDSIIDKTRDVLNKHGLAIAQFPAETTTGGPGLRTVLLHAESGEQLESTVPLLLNGKHDMQALGGAITYARRYGWAAVLGIANDEDDDGDTVSRPAPQPAEPFTGDLAEWRWSSGKHSGKTLAETDRAYIEWYRDSGPKADVRQICLDFLNRPTGDEDIPFG